ncbi:MAG: sulfotransferase [Leptolyngbya sp. SIO3F4]|nr:sulfotransferase [Leptolyngbya sp. SIO3F4]
MQSPRIVRHDLLPLTRSLRIERIVDAISDWAGQVLPNARETISGQTTFAELCSDWEDVTVLHSAIGQWLADCFGFEAFYASELESLATVADLAAYLAVEVDGVRPPTVREVQQAQRRPSQPSVWNRTGPYARPERVSGRTAFVLSPPRSGSTLLRTMLDGHPQIHAPPELHLLQFDTMGARRAVLEDTHRTWMMHGLCQALQRQLKLTQRDSYLLCYDFERRDIPIADVYSLLHKHSRDGWLVDKSPNYAESETWLRRAEVMFDQPHYIFLSRHPYAAITSFVRMRLHRLNRLSPGSQREHPWLVAERVWAHSVSTILSFMQEVPPERRCHVKFEDLARSPDTTMQEAMCFLQLEYSQLLLDPYEGDRLIHGVGDRHFHKRRHIDSLVANVTSSQIPPFKLGTLTRELADQLGYALGRDCAEDQ